MNNKYILLVVFVILMMGVLYHNDNRKHRQVFFDLGANNGDSVKSFIYGQSSLGGSSLNLRGEDGDWDIWIFEGSPVFTDTLINLKNTIDKKQYRTYLMTESVINTFDGSVEFYLDTINKDHNYWGSSLNKNHPDVIKSNLTSVNAKSYDLSRLLFENYRIEDYVVLKMDIEGTEYELIPHLIITGAIKYIDELAIEWHKIQETYPGITEFYIWFLQKMNIKVIHWQ